MAQARRVEVPFGDNLTIPQRVTRMLQIIDDLLPLAGLSQAEFCREDPREAAAVYAAALGRAASKLPPAFRAGHPEIDWEAIEEFRGTSFQDKIDALEFRDQLQERLPILKSRLEQILDETVPPEGDPD